MSQGIHLPGAHSTPDPRSENLLVRGLTLTAALGGLLFGYDTAVISGAVGAIDHNFIDPLNLSETAAGSLSGWTISSALLGCVLGAVLAGPLSNRFGRRGGLLAAAVLFLLSAIGSAYPELGLAPIGTMGAEALTPFILYRILGGIGIGIASMLSPMYIAEIAPAGRRGRLVTYQQIAIVGGMTIVYFVNWAIAARGDDAWVLSTGWRYMLLSGALPAAMFLVLLLFVPESPRWLVMKGRADAARDVLRRLTRDAHEAQEVLADIDRSLTVPSGGLLSFGPRVIVVGLMLSIFQQFVGINAVLYYAPLMFGNMGASTDSALLQTIIVGIANIVFTVIALLTVDSLGRKPLLIIGAVVMGISMVCLGSLFHSGNVGTFAIIAVVAYIAGFALSWGPVVWVLLAEIFPAPIKGKAMALAVAVQWIANLLVSWSFKLLDGSSTLNAMFNHGFAYWIYGVVSLLAAWFVWRFVPETKGHRLEAIQALWTDHEKSSPTASPQTTAASPRA